MVNKLFAHFISLADIFLFYKYFSMVLLQSKIFAFGRGLKCFDS